MALRTIIELRGGAVSVPAYVKFREVEEVDGTLRGRYYFFEDERALGILGDGYIEAGKVEGQDDRATLYLALKASGALPEAEDDLADREAERLRIALAEQAEALRRELELAEADAAFRAERAAAEAAAREAAEQRAREIEEMTGF